MTDKMQKLMFSPFMSFRNVFLNLMLLNCFHWDWTSWNDRILTEWYPHSALDEVALEMCEQSGWTLMLGFSFFSFLYWDQNIFKCKLIVTLEGACIRHLFLSSDNLQKWVCNSWVNVFLVCSGLFHSTWVLCFYRVFIHGSICSA